MFQNIGKRLLPNIIQTNFGKLIYMFKTIVVRLIQFRDLEPFRVKADEAVLIEPMIYASFTSFSISLTLNIWSRITESSNFEKHRCPHLQFCLMSPNSEEVSFSFRISRSVSDKLFFVSEIKKPRILPDLLCSISVSSSPSHLLHNLLLLHDVNQMLILIPNVREIDRLILYPIKNYTRKCTRLIIWAYKCT